MDVPCNREAEADQPEERRMLFHLGSNISEVIVDGEDIIGDGSCLDAALQCVGNCSWLLVYFFEHIVWIS